MSIKSGRTRKGIKDRYDTDTPPPPPVDLKPPLQGLITTDPDYLDNISFAEFGSVKLTWASIETAPGVYDFSAVDSLFTAHPTIKFRVRLMCGHNCPDWVKVNSGGAIHHDPSTANGASGEVPRYWTDAHYNDYMALMTAFATEYEDNPQLVEVPNAMTTTIFAEPFILGADGATIDRYWAGGYTRAKHELYLRNTIEGMMDLFPTTRISLAGHGKWEYIIQGGGGAGDGVAQSSWPFERDLLNDLYTTYGEHIVYEDHGLGPDDVYYTPGEPRTTASAWYAYMSGLETTDQTYGWQFTLNGGSMIDAAAGGVAMGACFLEYAAFEGLGNLAAKQAVHDDLLANAAGKP